MNVSELLERARSALGPNRLQRGLAPVPYERGAGGNQSQAQEAPASGLDCGTFVRWAAKLTLPAQGPVHGLAQTSYSWDTTGIVADALGQQRVFTKLDAPRTGCFIVYPDYVATPLIAGMQRTEHDGHVGIVTDTATSNGRTVATKVIHCSRLIEGMRRNFAPGEPRDSIMESDLVWFPVFEPIYVWCKAITP